MPLYTVQDTETGKTVTFEWNGSIAPTDADMEEVFAAAKQQTPETATPATIEPAPEQLTPKVDNTPEWAGKHPNLYGLLGAGKEVARFAGEGAALVGGGMAGAPLGPAGAIAGAGLAYGGVKQLERLLEGEKPSNVRAVKDVLEGATLEGGGQVIGKVIGGLAGKMLAPQAKRMTEGAKYNASKAKELGIELTPAEVTGSKQLALYEGMFDKSVFSADIINDWRELKQLKPLLEKRNTMLANGGGSPQSEAALGQKIKDQVDQFLKRLTLKKEADVNKLRDTVLQKMGSQETYESIGGNIQETVSAKSKEAYGRAKALYEELGTLAGDKKVTTPALQKKASDLLELESKKPPSMRDASLQKVLSDLSGSQDKELTQLLDNLPPQYREDVLTQIQPSYDWSTTQAIRSDLGQKIAQGDLAYKTQQPGTKLLSDAETGTYKQLKSALEQDIAKFAAAAS